MVAISEPTTMSSSNLQSLLYSNDNGKPTLSVLDQLLIPHEKKYIGIESVEDAWAVIRSMQIRGAPLIAIVAVLGLAVDVTTHNKTLYELEALDNDNVDAIMKYLDTKLDYLATSRPTAVNLFHALKEVKSVITAAVGTKTPNSTTARQLVCEAIVQHAEFMLKRDVSDNEAIGMYGAGLIQRHMTDPEKGARLVTICNTGSLATASYGTALGVARALNAQGKLQSIVALETRPYNQGSRLTAFEILEDELKGGMLICDSSAAALMKSRGVDAVVVGADRVCRNGDTANKIGTYSLAVIAAAHQVPFYVASPFTTLDTELETGEDIVIEERPAKELLETSRAPANMPVWNPAFDVTPAKYINGIITEKGIVEPNVGGSFDIAAFVKKHTACATEETGAGTKVEPASKLNVPVNYIEQTTASLPSYLAKFAPKAMAAIEATSANDLTAVEMGDGNLNLVFIISNTKNQKKIIVKQALPYVRCVGESWPLTLDRAYFEYTALTKEKEACPQFVPSLYYFSRPHGLMAMEFIPPPNIILRKGLIQGIRYPTMASDMGTFCAKTLFRTSGFALSETELRENVEFWCANKDMCALTEQVVFTEPYINASNNRWTSPQLDGDKEAIEKDCELKVAASRWKIKFVTETQALIHADLHSGSVMCSPEPGQTFVIDPEFAFYGPMGFDTGAFIANLFLSYVSQGGHENGEDYADWVLTQIETFWTTFEKQFIALWNDVDEHKGMKYQRELLGDERSIKLAQHDFLALLLTDTLGFAGMKMLRRLVGIAHVEDLDSIEDADVRSRCERHGLEIAKVFITTAPTIESIHDAVEVARSKKPTS